METIIAFVLLFSLRTISWAANVTIYNEYNYYYANPSTSTDIVVSQFPWKFTYDLHNWFSIRIHCINTPPIVTAINVTCSTEDNRTCKVKKKITQESSRRKGEEYYNVDIDRYLNSTEIRIKVLLYNTPNILCSSPVVVAKGRNVIKRTNKPLENEFQGGRICNGFVCVLVVDLTNTCDGPPFVTETKTYTTTENTVTAVEVMKPNNTFSSNFSTNHEITSIKNVAIDTKNPEHRSWHNIIWIIPSTIGVCITILMIYLISVKKCCHRNLHSVDATELNTYATANEVVYADLGFVRGDSQPPRRDEESPYAKIIGLIKPADGHTKNK